MIFGWMSKASDRESQLYEKYPERSVHLSDYLKAMGFDPARPADISFGQPVAGTSGKVTNSGVMILGTGSQSSSTNLEAQEFYPATLELHGAGYHFLVPATMITTRADVSKTRIVLKDYTVAYVQDGISCHNPFWHPSRVTCTVTPVPNIDPAQLQVFQQKGLATLIQQNLTAIMAPASALK